MTQRLSHNLKKKLEASLENLTPRQAGKLLLIYSQEYDRKKGAPIVFWDYPPVTELMESWERRVDELKDKDDVSYRRAVGLRNGFATLTRIFLEANRWATSDLWRLIFSAATVSQEIDRLILQDFQSEIARMTVYHFTEDIPRPLSWEEYEKAVEWYENQAIENLGELANHFVEIWARQQGYTPLEVPEDFVTAHNELSNVNGNRDYDTEDETEELRRLWVEAEGEEKILNQYFAGDRNRLEAWLTFGGCPEFNDLERDKKADEIYDRMVEMVKSGELVGGLCFSLINAFGPIPSHDWQETLAMRGRIPAWAALRSIWDGWLYDHGIFKSDELRFDVDLPDPIEKYFDVEGALEGDRLAATAKRFYLDCQKKPWGAGLVDPKKADFAALGLFLCAEESPLLGYYAPDLGWIEVEVFGKSEGDDVFLGLKEDQERPFWCATLKSLRERADAFDLKPEDIVYNPIREFYYPTDRPEEKRRAIAHLFQQLDTLRVSHRPFTYREKYARDVPSFLGLKFYTPLEEAVKDLGAVFDEIATFKLTYDLLSQEFFGGTPVLRLELRERLKNVEEMLALAESRLNQWLQVLSSDVWKLDTSGLRPVKTGPDEREAKRLAAVIIRLADEADDQDKTPTWLENGETFEQVTKRLTGFDYKSLELSYLRER